MHDDPRIYPQLPTKEPDPDMWALTERAFADTEEGSEWRTCWEFVLTHQLTGGEGAAFWHGASLAMAAAEQKYVGTSAEEASK